MPLQFIYHVKTTEQHPLYVKSNWIPPIQRSVPPETYLEEVKIKIGETGLGKPNNNLPHGERQALKEPIHNKIIVNIVMNRENKPRSARNNWHTNRLTGMCHWVGSHSRQRQESVKGVSCGK